MLLNNNNELLVIVISKVIPGIPEVKDMQSPGTLLCWFYIDNDRLINE